MQFKFIERGSDCVSWPLLLTVSTALTHCTVR